MKKLTTAFLALATLFALASCAADRKEPPAEESSNANAGFVIVTLQSGWDVAIPNEYYERVRIEFPEENRPGEDWLAFYTRATDREEWLFSLVRYDKYRYEQFLAGDRSGQSFFAKDGDDNYYGRFVPTDVQYSSQNQESRENYIELATISEILKADAITRNGLTPYSDDEFSSKPYTYNGEHINIAYYPYLAVNGTTDVVWRLVMSQPAAKGENGIWCVEHWYDERQDPAAYPIFPTNDDGLPAAEYYAARQAEADAGERPNLLVPEQAALDFVLSYFEPLMTPGLDSIARID
jgi:hypothetical protein